VTTRFSPNAARAACRGTALALCLVCAGAARGAPSPLLKSAAMVTQAQPPPASEAPVTVVACANPAIPIRDLVVSWAGSAGGRGAPLHLVDDPAACSAVQSGQTLPATTADLLVSGSAFREADHTLTQIRVAFSEPQRLDMRLYGRTFVIPMVSSAVAFPARLGAEPTPPVTYGPEVAPDRPPAAETPPPEGLFVQGMIALVQRRHLTGAASPDAIARAAVDLDALALRKLEEADQRAVAYAEPETAAVLKQLRALLILDGACSADTVAGLLRAAALLVPHNTDARAASAIGQIDDRGVSETCLRATEQELLHSLAQDRWNQGRVDDLARFYELAMNAASGTTDDRRTLPVDVAAQRLKQAWEDHPPPAPRVLEIGLGAGLSHAGVNEPIRGTAPALHLDLTFGRDSSGFGWRIGATIPWTRDLDLGQGTASWTRFSFMGGGRYRWRLRWFYGEADAALVLAPALANGHGFDSNLEAIGLDGGVNGGLRVGLRAGLHSLWIGAGASYFFARHIPGWPDLNLKVDNNGDSTSTTTVLPSVDVAVVVGFSQMLWR